MFLPALLVAAASAQQDPDRTLHYFVVDHSYSMVNKTSGGEKRWDFVGEKLEEWTKSLPEDGSADVVFLMFNQHVPGRQRWKNSGAWVKEFEGWKRADGDQALKFIRAIGTPQEGEGTALWNALGEAMRRVDLQGGSYAESWIYLFTDGEDTNSVVRRGDPFTFPEEAAGAAPLLKAWRALLKRRPNSYMIEQPLGQMEPPLAPEPVNPHIYTSRPELNDLLKVRVATSKPEYADLLQERNVELDIRLSGPGARRLSARQGTTPVRFRVSFEAEGGGVEVAVEPETLPLANGKQQLRVRVKGGAAKDGVRGKLKIGYPDLQGERIDVIGPKEVPLAFAAAAQVSIAKVTPSGTARWPVGRPLTLSVQHTGEAVSWDLGDGQQAAGDRVDHVYQRPGTYEVRVKATAAGRSPAEVALTVMAIEAAVTVAQQPEQGVIVGKPVRFEAGVVAAEKRQFDWQVDGGVRAGAEADGSVLELSFDKPGTHEVRVRAFTADVGVLERTVKVEVGAGVSVRLSKFASSVDAGLPAVFEAEVGGSFASGRLRWSLIGADGAPLGSAADGAAPVRGGVSRWETEVPRDLPRSVQLVAVADLSDEERARFGEARDLVPLTVRPPGLNMQKVQPVDTDVVEVGAPLVFEARWTGTKARDVEAVRWRVLADGQPVRAAAMVQPSRDAATCGATFSLDLSDAGDLLGKRLAVEAAPMSAGAPVTDGAATWAFAARLPRRSYRIVSPSLELGRLEYGNNLQVRLEPADYVSSVRWDWGDGEAEQASPAEDRAHGYGLDDGGARRVLATLSRIDGTTEQVQLLFDFVVPRLAIETTGVARLNRSLELQIGPASLAAKITEVRWDFGGGFGAPERDLKTSYMWTDRAGAVEVRARVKMDDGTERTLLPATVNVHASRTVRAAPEVIGGTTHGAVELRANVTPDSDYASIEVEVLKDGESVTTLTGDVASHAIVENEFGLYEFRFRARRVATPENPETMVELGQIGRTYRLRRWALAMSVLMGGGFLLYVLLRGALFKQYARSWKLRFTTDDVMGAEDLGSLATRMVRLRSLKGDRWSWFRWRKQVDVEAKELVRKFGEEAADEGVSRLAESTSALRVRARRPGTLTSPNDQWDGPYTPTNHRGLEVYRLPAPRSRPQEKTLYAWLEAKNWSPVYMMTIWVLALAGLGAWVWFATARCFIF